MPIGTLQRQLSDRPVTQENLLDFVNRELVPVVRSLGRSAASRYVTKVTMESVTASAWDFRLCDTTDGAIVVTLPDAERFTDTGVVVKRQDGANNVTIPGVDGGTLTLSTIGDSVMLWSTGDEWVAIAAFP